MSFFVFEWKPGTLELKQISVAFESAQECGSFIGTMQEGRRYKTINPEYKLYYAEVINK